MVSGFRGLQDFGAIYEFSLVMFPEVRLSRNGCHGCRDLGSLPCFCRASLMMRSFIRLQWVRAALVSLFLELEPIVLSWGPLNASRQSNSYNLQDLLQAYSHHPADN